MTGLCYFLTNCVTDNKKVEETISSTFLFRDVLINMQTWDSRP